MQVSPSPPLEERAGGEEAFDVPQWAVPRGEGSLLNDEGTSLNGDFAFDCQMVLPLLGGEGRGEGKGISNCIDWASVGFGTLVRAWHRLDPALL